MRAFKARDQFRGSSSLGTWLMHIAANLVRDHEVQQPPEILEAQAALRRGSERHQRLDSRPAKIARGTGSCQGAGASHLESRIEFVGAAADGFLLRFVEDMDLLEIADVTGMKEGTVKTHLFRAVQSVRLGLEEGK